MRPIYRTGVPLPSKCCILYIFSTNISTEYFKHAAHSPVFSSKCRLFHNATFFGSCIIHLIYGVQVGPPLKKLKVNFNEKWLQGRSLKCLLTNTNWADVRRHFPRVATGEKNNPTTAHAGRKRRPK